jgi:hypothetical protein
VCINKCMLAASGNPASGSDLVQAAQAIHSISAAATAAAAAAKVRLLLPEGQNVENK